MPGEAGIPLIKIRTWTPASAVAEAVAVPPFLVVVEVIVLVNRPHSSESDAASVVAFEVWTFTAGPIFLQPVAALLFCDT